jgi:S-adenosylhomocysteine hydrolase
MINAAGLTPGVITDNTAFWFPLQAEITSLMDHVESSLLFLSYNYGARKSMSEPNLFDCASQIVDPRKTLIIDDSEDKVAIAREKGFLSLRYSCHGSLETLGHFLNAGDH